MENNDLYLFYKIHITNEPVIIDNYSQCINRIRVRFLILTPKLKDWKGMDEYFTRTSP